MLRVRLRPGEIEHELAEGVRLHVGGRGGSEAVLVVQRDGRRIPARAGADAAAVSSSAARNAWRRKGEPPASSASQAAGSMSVMLVEVFVRIERSHASGSGGGDGLTIHVIGDVARGEHAGHAGGGGARLRCRS